VVFSSAFVYFADLLTFVSPKIGTFGEGDRKVGARRLFFSGRLVHFGAFQKEIGGRQKMEGTGDFLS
jgi:hypothetical protein